MRNAKLQIGKGIKQSFWHKNLTEISHFNVLAKRKMNLLAANLHCKGEMAALGVSDYAGVHGGLDTPAPLQISHRILVQVTGQHCGNARTHPPG